MRRASAARSAAKINFELLLGMRIALLVL